MKMLKIDKFSHFAEKMLIGWNSSGAENEKKKMKCKFKILLQIIR